MSPVERKLKKLRQQFNQVYQDLANLDKQIIRLFSVIYEPISRTKFLQCLNAIGEKKPNGKAFNSTSLKPHLESLIEKQLLIQEKNQSPRCNPLIAEIATREAIKEGKWQKMVQAMNKYAPIRSYYYDEDVKRFDSVEQLIREV